MGRPDPLVQRLQRGSVLTLRWAAQAGGSTSHSRPSCVEGSFGSPIGRSEASVDSRLSATTSHPSSQKIAAPTTGLKARRTYPDVRGQRRNLQSARSGNCLAGRHRMLVERLQVERANWRCRPRESLSGNEFRRARCRTSDARRLAASRTPFKWQAIALLFGPPCAPFGGAGSTETQPE